MYLQILPSNNKNKRYDAFFIDDNDKLYKKISFGSPTMENYTMHGDKDRRYRYLVRHNKRENWNTPFSAGSLSRHILWGDSKNINKNISSFKKKFDLQ
jgi:hypothetical protein